MRQYLAGYRVYLVLLLIIALMGLALVVTHSLGADPLCGNGSIDSPSEECDDGNTADGDCCSATCMLDPIATHCNNHSVCAKEGACNGVGICIDLGCRVGVKCRGGGGAPAKYCEYPSGGPCSCTASTSTTFPDCAQLTGSIDDQAPIDEAAASLEAKGLDISEVGPDDYFWILMTEVSPIVGCDTHQATGGKKVKASATLYVIIAALFPALGSNAHAPNPPCSATDLVQCMGNFLASASQCGSESEPERTPSWKIVGEGSCINAACWCHDACGRGKCTQGGCIFTGNACDQEFFDSCDNCSDWKSKLICQGARKTQNYQIEQSPFNCSPGNTTTCPAPNNCCGCQNFTEQCCCGNGIADQDKGEDCDGADLGICGAGATCSAACMVRVRPATIAPATSAVSFGKGSAAGHMKASASSAATAELDMSLVGRLARTHHIRHARKRHVPSWGLLRCTFLSRSFEASSQIPACRDEVSKLWMSATRPARVSGRSYAPISAWQLCSDLTSGLRSRHAAILLTAAAAGATVVMQGTLYRMAALRMYESQALVDECSKRALNEAADAAREPRGAPGAGSIAPGDAQRLRPRCLDPSSQDLHVRHHAPKRPSFRAAEEVPP